MKELPYFKFEPAEWLVGDINYCSFKTQGVFISIICQYWLCNCNMLKRTLSERFPNAEKEINELISKNIIKENGDIIIILFLDELLAKRVRISEVNSKNGKAGSLVKQGLQANAKRTLSETKANANIREEKRIEKKREIKTHTQSTFEKSNISTLEQFTFALKEYSERKYSSADMDYYFECVRNWALSKNVMKKDWLATVAGFMLRDIRDNKFKKKQ